ncbi:hypothetical protein [Solibacillus daqui]|uniref:hypothetical protein n=1 Tax=Solibacillus daqui TaxID=2912187 RepID=UPI0023655329|nr:hypothetical protein [Solibacillus daqui]
MRTSAVMVSVFSLFLLAGCNWNTAERDTTTPAEDVERGVDDVMDDTRDAIDDTIDTVDPNQPRNGEVNESTIDGNKTYPNGSSNPNGENGITAPGAPSVNQEDIIEDKKDREDKDKVDNQ